jgi:hypothetical protein
MTSLLTQHRIKEIPVSTKDMAATIKINRTGQITATNRPAPKAAKQPPLHSFLLTDTLSFDNLCGCINRVFSKKKCVIIFLLSP